MKKKSLSHVFNGGIKRIILFFYPSAFPQIHIEKPNDPERKVLFPYCKGLGIDVGCGSKKTHPNALGIDVTPKGKPGSYGSEKRQISVADIQTSGDNLYMFADGVLDYVVARHNLEHYIDPIKTLEEWKRVLKKGGVLGVVLPDEEEANTIAQDPTHKHAFTQKSYQRMLRLVGGFKILSSKKCVPGLSFATVAKKVS